MNRRHWLGVASVWAAAADLAPMKAQERTSGERAPRRISKEMLVAALKSIGLEYTDAHLDLALPRVNRSLGNIESLRKAPVPLDTNPAFVFSPFLPGRLPPRTGSFAPSKPPQPKAFSSVADLAYLPVTQLAPLLRSRRVSSEALTRMYLERLKQFGPKLNCVITLTEDLALEQAKRADTEIRQGKYRGPLHGVPWGAKDLLATKGIPTTWGAEPYQDQVFDYDAAVVERLEQAGAVLVAKLSMGALAMGGLWFGGMTKTPWNLSLTSSGSSAGSASATAAGLVGFSIGTETLGSIISPSTRCGATGLRPTFGRVSRHGAMALSWTMDKIGPICRSVEDCALVLKAIHGHDARDPSSYSAPLAWDPGRPLSSLKIGVVQDNFDSAREGDKQVLADALAGARKAGLNLQPVKLPDFDTGPILLVLNAEAAAAFDDLTRDGGVDRLKAQDANAWPNSFRTSRLIPAVEYIRAQRARTLLMQQFDKLMADWDVLVSPPQSPLLSVTNLTGHPQICVPCGLVDGTPRSLVFTGRLCEEGLPMRAALAYQQATEWHTMAPSFREG